MLCSDQDTNITLAGKESGDQYNIINCIDKVKDDSIANNNEGHVTFYAEQLYFYEVGLEKNVHTHIHTQKSPALLPPTKA